MHDLRRRYSILPLLNRAGFPGGSILSKYGASGKAGAVQTSECGRFEVDPAEHYGLRLEEISALDAANSTLQKTGNADSGTDHSAEPIDARQASSQSVTALRSVYVNLTECHTGGGCFALRHDCDDGGYLLITDSEGLQIPADDAADVYVGRYAANGDTVEEARNISIGEAETWIDAALSRSRHPKNIADYFAKRLGAGHGDDSLRGLPVESACGQECVQAIDVTAGVLKHLRAAFGDSDGRPFDQAEEQLIEIARRITGVYWRG